MTSEALIYNGQRSVVRVILFSVVSVCDFVRMFVSR